MISNRLYMKLRIKGNSIRLRLTQTEVSRIEKGEEVRESVSFGKEKPVFSYVLCPASDTGKIKARFVHDELFISFPYALAQMWAATNQVGVEEVLNLDNGDTLHVLIEKDFQCLHKRPNEDESDNFTNPIVSA